MVPPGATGWGIRDSVEATGAKIYSPSSSQCPANKRAGHSDRLGQKGWQFTRGAGKGWVAGDITVTCSSHSHKE